MQGSRLASLFFAQPCYYTTLPRSCQGVFENFFQKFSSASFRGRKCFDIISHPSLFVKRFFKSFFNFFFVILYRAGLLSDSLHIIALSLLFVKRFLTSFSVLATQALLHKRSMLRLYTLNKRQVLPSLLRRDTAAFELPILYMADPHIRKSPEIRQKPFTFLSKCGILDKVKITERQMR